MLLLRLGSATAAVRCDEFAPGGSVKGVLPKCGKRKNKLGMDTRASLKMPGS